jgi:hypothetical protein
MDPSFAVFNCHVNDAKTRALVVLRDHFPHLHREVLKYDEQGIMSIFTVDPTPATTAFVALVTAFVNES